MKLEISEATARRKIVDYLSQEGEGGCECPCSKCYHRQCGIRCDYNLQYKRIARDIIKIVKGEKVNVRKF